MPKKAAPKTHEGACDADVGPESGRGQRPQGQQPHGRTAGSAAGGWPSSTTSTARVFAWASDGSWSRSWRSWLVDGWSLRSTRLPPAFAALQTAREWRKGGARPHRPLAGAGALTIGLAGAVSTPLVGVAILGLVGASLLLAFGASAASRRRATPVDDAGFTIRCGLFAGFAAACMGITARYSLTAAVGLVLIVAAYEIGDYLVGSGARNPFEGPVAGATAIVVVTFAITAVGLKPFVFPGSFALAALAATLCPAGQVMASVILPKVDASASALRRIDSLLYSPRGALSSGHLV